MGLRENQETLALERSRYYLFVSETFAPGAAGAPDNSRCPSRRLGVR